MKYETVVYNCFHFLADSAFVTMAEFPNLGNRCDFETCKQLDFLPFECDGCSKTYCLDHKFPDDHQCCKSNIKEATGEYTGTKSYKCSYEDCDRHELLPVLCDQCTRNFCLQHRHQQDHKCDKLDTSPSKPSKTAEHVQQIIASKQDKIPQNKLRGRKSSKTAAKVALMKMKMGAVGEKGIPETDKVYLQIYLPQGGENKTKPMFFSKVWSIGRVVDSIAENAKLRNTNNMANEKKLRLFLSEDGEQLQLDKSLESFVKEEILFSGSSVILEYIDTNSTASIDISGYIT